MTCCTSSTLPTTRPDLRAARGDLATKQAALAQAELELARYEKLWRMKQVAEEIRDSALAKQKEAKASVASSQAAIDPAKLNLDYTRIRAPLTGRIGATLVNVGNLVGPDQNAELASIVQLDPIHVIFRPGGAEMDAILAQQRKAPVQVRVTLSDGVPVPHLGAIDCIDNRVDPATGTLKVRAIIATPDGLLLPGRFARVWIDLGAQPDTLLVPQRALVENQGGFLLYVVANDGKVQARKVEARETHDGLRAIASGVSAGERVIVSGVQLVRAVDQYPDITPPRVQFTADYEGAEAEVVEQAVTQPIEEQINGAEGMLYMSSISADDGSMVLTVTLDIGYDLEIAAVDVRNRTSVAQSQLPDEVVRGGVQNTKQAPFRIAGAERRRPANPGRPEPAHGRQG